MKRRKTSFHQSDSHLLICKWDNFLVAVWKRTWWIHQMQLAERASAVQTIRIKVHIWAAEQSGPLVGFLLELPSKNLQHNKKHGSLWSLLTHLRGCVANKRYMSCLFSCGDVCSGFGFCFNLSAANKWMLLWFYWRQRDSSSGTNYCPRLWVLMHTRSICFYCLYSFSLSKQSMMKMSYLPLVLLFFPGVQTIFYFAKWSYFILLSTNNLSSMCFFT